MVKCTCMVLRHSVLRTETPSAFALKLYCAESSITQLAARNGLFGLFLGFFRLRDWGARGDWDRESSGTEGLEALGTEEISLDLGEE